MHKQALASHNASEAKKQTIADYFNERVSKGEVFRGSERLPEEVLVNRLTLASTLMMGGIPLSKLDDEVSGLKRVFEGDGQISVGHMRELIPDIRATEIQNVIQELKNCGPVSIVFDGTTDVCEVAVVIVRWCDNQFRSHQRILSSAFLQRSMTGDQLTAFLSNIIFTTYAIAPHRVHGFIRDGASVNGAAMRTMKIICQRSVDVVCSSHTACLAGNKLSKVALPLAAEFVSKWSQLMTTSNIARQEWRLVVGRRAKTKSMVRWESEYDVMRDVLVNFADVENLVSRADLHFAENLRADMRELLALAPQNADGLSPKDVLQLELAVYHDVGQHIFNLVYDFEGDDFLSPYIYDRVESVLTNLTSIVTLHEACPNIALVVRRIVPNEAEVQCRTALLNSTCVKGAAARNKFIAAFIDGNGSCFASTRIYKSLAMLRPCKITALANEEVEARIGIMCQLVPLFRSIDGFGIALMAELAAYRECVANYPLQDDSPQQLSQWWNL